MKNKKIGIVGWSTGDNSFGVTKPYLEYFSKFGIVEVLTPQEGIRKDINLVVLPGGADTPSWKYGQSPGFYNSNPDVHKEYFVETNLPQYIKAGVPVFGICLGLQQIATMYGSVLTQHMYHPQSSPREELTHHVHIPTRDRDGSLMEYESDHTLMIESGKKDKFEVNSLHHQAVRWNNLGPDLDILLVDEDGKYVEALKHKTLPIYAVQYHPEHIFDQFSIKLIKSLLTVNDKSTVDTKTYTPV